MKKNNKDIRKQFNKMVAKLLNVNENDIVNNKTSFNKQKELINFEVDDNENINKSTA